MPNEKNEFICVTCRAPLRKTNFHRTHSEFYTDSFLPICNDCFGRKFKQYAIIYHSNKLAMQRMCMAFDIYFNEDLFDICDKDDNTVIGNYFRKLNMAQYKEKTFEDSLKEGFEFSGNRKLPRSEVQVDSARDNKANEEKWGAGFADVDYDFLNSHYKYLKNANPKCDSNQEIFIRDLCYIHMQKMKAMREDNVDNYNKLTESYRKSFNQAGLKAADGVKTNDDCWGVLTEMVSRYCPEEYYKNRKRHKDIDGLGEYYERMAVRPLKNIMLGTQVRDKEFYIGEGDD